MSQCAPSRAANYPSKIRLALRDDVALEATPVTNGLLPNAVASSCNTEAIAGPLRSAAHVVLEQRCAARQPASSLKSVAERHEQKNVCNYIKLEA